MYFTGNSELKTLLKSLTVENLNLQSNSVVKMNSQGLLESDSSDIVAAQHFVNPDKLFEILIKTEIKDDEPLSSEACEIQTEIKTEIKEEAMEDCEAEVWNFRYPDSSELSHQKTPKNATPPTVKSPLVQRKSAKESNIDSDSDSDVEWKSNSAKKSPRKNKTKRQAGSPSSEDEELGIRDRPRFFDQVGHQTTNASIEKKHFFTK